jgi:hypothetical protein
LGPGPLARPESPGLLESPAGRSRRTPATVSSRTAEAPVDDLDVVSSGLLDAALDLAIRTDVRGRVHRREGGAAKRWEQRERGDHVGVAQLGRHDAARPDFPDISPPRFQGPPAARPISQDDVRSRSARRGSRVRLRAGARLPSRQKQTRRPGDETTELSELRQRGQRAGITRGSGTLGGTADGRWRAVGQDAEMGDTGYETRCGATMVPAAVRTRRKCAKTRRRGSSFGH